MALRPSGLVDQGRMASTAHRRSRRARMPFHDLGKPVDSFILVAAGGVWCPKTRKRARARQSHCEAWEPALLLGHPAAWVPVICRTPR
jgi:hypothetical protein